MRVGHRIIEINGQSVVAVPHERIVNLLATSVGEVTTPVDNLLTISFSAVFCFLFFMTRDVGLGCDCVVVSDPHEDDANIHVPTADRTGESSLHIMLK